MARHVDRFKRVYVDGFDMSGYARSIGPLENTYDEVELTAYQDAVKGYLLGEPQTNVGTLNAVFDNTATSGVQAVLGTPGTERIVTVAIGMTAAPVQGDPVFTGQFAQSAWQADEHYVNIPFAGWAGDATSLLYGRPWGRLLHAWGAETAGNTAIGIDNYAEAVSTVRGGYMVYHVTAFAGGAGTFALRVQHAAANNDGSFANLVSATLLASADVPLSGIVATALPTTTVNRYLRWQLTDLVGVTSVSFLLSFIRG